MSFSSRHGRHNLFFLKYQFAASSAASIRNYLGEREPRRLLGGLNSVDRGRATLELKMRASILFLSISAKRSLNHLVNFLWRQQSRRKGCSTGCEAFLASQAFFYFSGDSEYSDQIEST
ncbi:hypothetical protein CDL15_Pgr005148 [Punica granatum]|uniref:Uncharacterized protein n=1 Tax=Punica granatum TaxID=22663 RepID=A0A218WQ25_PUNGR|nr:hypothetical protein CDL15_Pgr005148 [Punica granatum]